MKNRGIYLMDDNISASAKTDPSNFNIDALYDAMDLLYDNDHMIVTHDSHKKTLEDHLFIDHRGKQRINKSKKLIYFTPDITKDKAFYMKIIKGDKMKVYISGPMSGLHDNNYPMFDKFKSIFELLGYEVVSPADIGREIIASGILEGLSEDEQYNIFIREDLKALLTCTHIYMLDDWMNSNGAKLEAAVAVNCGIKAVLL